MCESSAGKLRRIWPHFLFVVAPISIAFFQVFIAFLIDVTSVEGRIVTLCCVDSPLVWLRLLQIQLLEWVALLATVKCIVQRGRGLYRQNKAGLIIANGTILHHIAIFGQFILG